MRTHTPLRFMLHSTSRYPCNVRLKKDAWSEHCRNLQRLGDPEFVVGVLVNRADAKPTLRTCYYIRTCALNLGGVARVAAGRFIRCTASGRTGPRERKNLSQYSVCVSCRVHRCCVHCALSPCGALDLCGYKHQRGVVKRRIAGVEKT